MTLDGITGNRNVCEALKGMISSGRIPHAIMFHEDDGGGAVSLCMAFLESLMGESSKLEKMIHPDVHFVFPVNSGSLVSSSSSRSITSELYLKQWRELVLSNPNFTERDLSDALGIEGKTAIIAVGEARSILEKLSFNSLEGGYKAVVVYLPEKMNADAANRLLKSIEEPSDKTQFLLVTHAPESVLQTISSRCQRIRLESSGGPSVMGEAMREDRDMVLEFFEAVSRRDLLSALSSTEAMAAIKSRERTRGLFIIMEDVMREVFFLQQNLPELLSSGTDERTGSLSRSLKKSFSRNAMDIINKTSLLFDRNVNPKILFTDLTNRLFAKI